MRIFLAIISLLFAGTAIYFIMNYFKRRTQLKKRDFIENSEYKHATNLREAELYLFMVDWCPHCKETKEVWEKFKKEYKSDKYAIAFKEIDCDEKENLANNFKIEEYPTIVLVNNDKKYYYDANIRPDTLDKFINTIMEL